jgi:hypothetical protein
MFATTGPVITIPFHVVNSDGELVVESMQYFEPEEYKFSTEGYDLQMGENYCRAKFPKIEIFVKDEDGNGAELTVETLIQPTLSEYPDGVGIGRVKTPTMPISIAWIFMPWNKITGKLIVQGKEIPVSGHGWSDHQYGTDADFFRGACQYYYWGILPLGEHTLTFFEAQGSRIGGHRPIKWLWDYKGDHIYEYIRDADFYVKLADVEEGDTVPRELTVLFEHTRIRGVLTCKYKALLQKQVLASEGRTVILNRAAYDCHATLEIDGEPVDKTFVRIFETAYEPDPEPAPAQPLWPEPKPASESRLSINSKMKEVLKDPEGQAVLERYLPGITTFPQTKLGAGMVLKTIFKMPQSGVSAEMMNLIDEDLRRID